MNAAIEGTITIGEALVDYVIFGKGERNLILLESITIRPVKGNGKTVANTYRSLGEGFRVTILDRRRDLPEGFTIEEMAEDVSLCMEALGIQRAAVIGFSQGGMIAQCLALSHPEKVTNLVLCCTLCRITSAAKAILQRWEALAGEEDYEAYLRDLLLTCYSRPLQEKFRRVFPMLSRMMEPVSGDRFQRLCEACVHFDVYERLQEIRCPVLVLGGEEDQVMGIEGPRELAEALGCELYLYEGLGHAFYEEAPDFGERVLSFLGQK